MSVEFRGHVLAPDPLGPCRVVVEDDRIVAIEPSRDAPEGTWIVPGLVDIQLNGAYGVDFAAPDDLDVARARIAASGVTTFLATLVSASPGAYAEPLAALVPDRAPGLARLAGVHLEGPWLSSTYPGAHDPAALRPPSTAELTEFLAPGTVRLVTLAPELTGGLTAIGRLTAAGVAVALGHTNADEATTRAALDAGATLGTHLFNAMRPFHHRDPGAAGTLLDAGCAVSMIADGVHVSDAALRLAWAAKGASRFALVSDGVAPLGLPPGKYRVGTWDVVSDGAVCRLAGRDAGGIGDAVDRRRPAPGGLRGAVRRGDPGGHRDAGAADRHRRRAAHGRGPGRPGRARRRAAAGGRAGRGRQSPVAPAVGIGSVSGPPSNRTTRKISTDEP